MLPCIVRPILSVTHATVSKFDCKKKNMKEFLYIACFMDIKVSK